MDRVLLLLERPQVTRPFLDVVRQRAAQGPVVFRVLVPNPAAAEWHPLHPERQRQVQEAERTLLRVLPVIQDAVDGAVRGRVSHLHDPVAATEELLLEEAVDEIIILAWTSGRHWPHLRLEGRLRHLRLPVTVVVAQA